MMHTMNMMNMREYDESQSPRGDPRQQQHLC